MNEADEESGIAKIVHGDEASARELRANLAVFARRSGSPEIRQMVASVLAGHRNIRDVLQTSEFNQTGMRHLENIERGLSRLTDEQRAELAPDAAAGDAAARGSGFQPPQFPRGPSAGAACHL